MQTAAKFHI